MERAKVEEHSVGRYRVLSDQAKQVKLLLDTFVVAFDRLARTEQMKAQRLRHEMILYSMSKIVGSQGHHELRNNLQKYLAKSLNFQYAIILFFDKTDGSLYGLQKEDKLDPKKNLIVEENIVRIPISLGLTGQAVAAKDTLFFPKAIESSNYVVEVDNFLRLPHFENIIVSPIFENEGTLVGVIQLINKLDG
jgi:hypothetical protein